ncbi:MAG: tripartite tricarboxylate transporter substrate binding protein [Betaproteobacteria bacterium]|nr:tripartite tricarboxylate transporter substrate binding protein [Betaproteobacteria bacterium]
MKSFAALVFTAAGILAGSVAHAQNYPVRPIRLIVPFAPGGSNDAIARLMAANLGPRLGQPVVVENRPGAGSQIGLESVVRSPADGYVLLFGATDGLAVVPAMKKQAPYDPVRDFTPIAAVARVPLVFVVHAKFPPATMAEFVAAARAKPNGVRYGSAGYGSLLHLGVEQLLAVTKAEMVHIPYKGGGPMMQDVVAGQVDMVITAVDFTKRFTESGQLKALAIADTTRHAQIPNVPTTAEAGMPDLLVVSWFGILGPAGLPKAIVDAIGREVALALEDTTLRERMLNVGGNASLLNAGDYGRHIAEEYRRWSQLVRDAKIPLQD